MPCYARWPINKSIMVEEFLVQGLKNAVSKGETLKQAMMSFFNAGYDREDIEESARKYLELENKENNEVNSDTLDKSDNKKGFFKKIFSSSKSQKLKENSQKKEQNTKKETENKKTPNKNRVSSYDKEYKKPKKLKIFAIILGVIFVLILALLIILILYGEQILSSISQ